MVEAVTPPNPADPADKTRTVPDPTLLTIDSIRREITMLENLFDTRLNDAEKLRNERLSSVDKLMERSEEQRREQKADTAAAVTAALDSQKEATAKMEKSISDQITSLRSNFDTSLRGIQSTVADLKDRLTVLESIKVGQTEQRTDARASIGAVVGIVGGVVGLVGLIITVVLILGAG